MRRVLTSASLLGWLLLTVSALADQRTRTFRDATGSHAVKADFLELWEERVYLRKQDGKVIDLPLKRLSADDQKWVMETGAKIPFNVQTAKETFLRKVSKAKEAFVAKMEKLISSAALGRRPAQAAEYRRLLEQFNETLQLPATRFLPAVEAHEQFKKLFQEAKRDLRRDAQWIRDHYKATERPLPSGITEVAETKPKEDGKRGATLDDFATRITALVQAKSNMEGTDVQKRHFWETGYAKIIADFPEVRLQMRIRDVKRSYGDSYEITMEPTEDQPRRVNLTSSFGIRLTPKQAISLKPGQLITISGRPVLNAGRDAMYIGDVHGLNRASILLERWRVK